MLRFANTIRSTWANAVNAAANAGAGPSVISICGGTKPAKGTAPSNVLATIAVGDPAFTESGGVLTAAAIAQVQATAAGTATHFIWRDSDGNFIADGDTGTSGADMNLATVTFTVGGNVDVQSWTITMGNN